MEKRKAICSLLLATALLVCCSTGCGDQGIAAASAAPVVSDVPEQVPTEDPNIQDIHATAPENSDVPETQSAEDPAAKPTEEAEATSVPAPIATEVPESGSIYQKIHFLLDNSSHGTVDSWEDLNQAIQEMLEFAAEKDFHQDFQIMVEFQSDYLNTEQYLALEQERDSLETDEDIQSWRERSAAWSWEYHSNLIAENLGALSGLHYNLATPVERAPNVILSIDIQNVTADTLAYTANQEAIKSLSISPAELNKDTLE